MERILVAEDDADVREALVSTLRDAGFEVFEAKNGAATLRAIQLQPVDLILCDMFMPGMDGLETIRNLRTQFPLVKIIAISGHGSTGKLDMLPMARHLGAAEILHKPVARAKLLAIIRRVLEESRHPSAGRE